MYNTLMQRLVLIDGNAIFHRAYHAMPNFTTSKGELVGAVYGFTSMLLKIYQDLKPTHLIATFDRSTPTFRKEMYVGYQAHRPKMDVDLSSQFEGVYKVLDAFRVPIFAVDGYEADDVIGTLARQAIEDKTFTGEVIIVTGDKDLMQLITPRVKVYTPIKGLTEAKLYGEAEVQERFGLTPHQIIDLKALMGDASDGYPGVAGIGPKTASTLLQKYETLENIYQHLGELPERQARLLAEEAEAAGMSQKLATIVTDVPIHFNANECQVQHTDHQKVVETLRSFEFRSITNRYLELVGEKPLAAASSTLSEQPKPEKKKTTKADDDQLSLL
jgi:DNA polymerase-1